MSSSGSLAVACTQAVNAFSGLRDRGLIDDAELLRLAYRFAGEVVDVEAMLARGKQAGPVGPAVDREPVADLPASLLEP